MLNMYISTQRILFLPEANCIADARGTRSAKSGGPKTSGQLMGHNPTRWLGQGIFKFSRVRSVQGVYQISLVGLGPG